MSWQKREDTSTLLLENDSEALQLKHMSQEFSITGVNQYKTQLETNINLLNKKVKDM